MNVTTPQAPTFTRPLPPEPDIQRDAEMLDLYFDPTRTTREIAEHFKLSVVVVVAWFQRPDIAAIIEYVTAASERRARDIVRENLPGTIDVLQRISLLRNDERTSRAAASALLTFARGRALPKSTASARSRSADSSPRDAHDTSRPPGRVADAAPPLDPANHNPGAATPVDHHQPIPITPHEGLATTCADADPSFAFPAPSPADHPATSCPTFDSLLTPCTGSGTNRSAPAA